MKGFHALYIGTSIVKHSICTDFSVAWRLEASHHVVQPEVFLPDQSEK